MILLLLVAPRAFAAEWLVAPSGSIQDVLDDVSTGDVIYVPWDWAGPDVSLSITHVDVEIAGEDPSLPPFIPSVTVSNAERLTLRDLVISADGYGGSASLDGYGDTFFDYGVFADGVDLELDGVQLWGGEGYGVIAVDGSVEATDVYATGFGEEPAVFVLAESLDRSLGLEESTFEANAAGAIRVAGAGQVVDVTGRGLSFYTNGSLSLAQGGDLRLEDIGLLSLVDVISEGATTSTTVGLGGSVYLYSAHSGPFAFTDVWIRGGLALQGRAISIEGLDSRTAVTFEDVLLDDTSAATKDFGLLYVSFVNALTLDKVVIRGSTSLYGAAYLFGVGELIVTDTSFEDNTTTSGSGVGAAMTLGLVSTSTFTRLRLCGNTGEGSIVQMSGTQSIVGLIAHGNHADHVLETTGDPLSLQSATFAGNSLTTGDITGTMSALYMRNVLFGDDASGVSLDSMVPTTDYDYLFSLDGQSPVYSMLYPYMPPEHWQVASDPWFESTWIPYDCGSFPTLGSSSVAIDNGDPASPRDTDGSVADIGAMTGQAGSWWVDDDLPGGDDGDTAPPDTGTYEWDYDGDGYATPADCDDHAPRVNPGAWDIPGDETDQDCDGKDASVALSGGCGCSSSGAGGSMLVFGLAMALPALRRRPERTHRRARR